MSDAHSSLDDALGDIDRLRRTLKQSKSKQVQSLEEKRLVKSVCLAWFNGYRARINGAVDSEAIHETDELYRVVLGAADRSTSRTKYDSDLKDVRKSLVTLRTEIRDGDLSAPADTTEDTPDFSKLVPSADMQAILKRRWIECSTCVNGGAPLAAVVMMGGLVEALLLARIHRESNKSPIFAATSAPTDKKTGKVLQLQEWTLRHYIDVAHELKWITRSAKDIGEVVRDYRNYIHPFKELSHGVSLGDGDARMFWEISKEMSRQVIKSVV